MKVHLSRCVGRVLEYCVFVKAAVYQDLLDGPFELGGIEPALELAFECNSVALLEDLVGQRGVGVNAIVDGHLQAA
jgi:hypothetical protein